MNTHWWNAKSALPVLLIASRLIFIITLPLQGMRGFGDFIHFYRMAAMGIPYVDFWVEFPPIFPFLSSFLYTIADGRQHVYDYLLIAVLTLAQATSLAIFIRIAQRIFGEVKTSPRGLFYFSILASLSYGWWYFDPLAELMAMAALWYLLEGKDTRSAVLMGLGITIKLFPILLLPLAWKLRPVKNAVLISVISLGIVVGIYGTLYFNAPDMTKASLVSQSSKGSWETIWALLDGNFGTGNFGAESERFDPTTATLLRGNPPKIAPWLSLLPFVVLGGWMFLKSRLETSKEALAFLGITWCIFFIWSPGWSPQWVIYLIPLILLTFPERQAVLLSTALVFVNILEW
ncbi:MAG TPA: glycosyltransferase 87 family protein, partial [Anaerolineales bacterium]|nr:glycosyltransferase 87 family protein [Anaerolineales bacterium]